MTALIMTPIQTPLGEATIQIQPDWRLFGECFTDANSEEQSYFLEGLLIGFERMSRDFGGPHAKLVQFSYIADHLRDELPDSTPKIAALLRTLSEYLDDAAAEIATNPEAVAA